MRPVAPPCDGKCTDLAVLGVHALELLDQVEHVRGMLVIEREPFGVLLGGGLRKVLLPGLDEAVMQHHRTGWLPSRGTGPGR